MKGTITYLDKEKKEISKRSVDFNNFKDAVDKIYEPSLACLREQRPAGAAYAKVYVEHPDDNQQDIDDRFWLE